MSPSKPNELQRIAKLLARAGIASRRDVERMIAEGRVALNGAVLDTPATLLPSLAGVTVDGEPVKAAAPARLFRFHKPQGLLTAARDPKGRPTIYDRLPRDLPRLMPVGRLDLNTEGLLLMTTDGELKRQLELPSSGVERSYRARAYGAVTQDQLEQLIEGVEIDGVRYGQIDANLERRTGANVWIEMTLTEGKNREVRRVLEHLGLKVSRLIRTRYGPFHLADLPLGAVDEVRQHDLIAFRRALAGPGGGKAASALELAVRPYLPRDSAAPKPAPSARARGGERRPSKPSSPARPAPAEAGAGATRSGPRRTESDRRKPAAQRVRKSADPAIGKTGDPATPDRAAPQKRKTGWAKPKPRSGPPRKPRTKR
ncbi:pseudouridine synthase [Sphingosinithalassobacter sp. CS137]|uniref:pseudouridine synthase n=1 Tax=Sphingosinithalassobacter sp. CS137 TaxID=2762748 RepID=UPI00165D693C|nr:pseudouridine synthase [Sphingosinithalassobacter sp. CS137]